MKPIYKPQDRPYSEDINDLVEDINKGGPGSGKRGHTTYHNQEYKGHSIKLHQKQGPSSGRISGAMGDTAIRHEGNEVFNSPEHAINRAKKMIDTFHEPVEKGWNATSPREGFAYQANKDKKIQGVGNGKYAAYEKNKKVNQTFSSSDQAKEYLESKEHQEPEESKE